MITRFLIAEDDCDDFDLFIDAVKKSDLPIKVTRVEFCDDIMRVINEDGAPEIIIIDGHLPGKSVFSCIETLKADDRISAIPLIVFTGSIEKQWQDECYKMGVDKVIEKPSSFDELVAIIKQIYSTEWRPRVSAGISG